MNDVTEGIVLSSMDYREKDALISVLTRQFGRLSLVAKAAMSIQSKNAPACLPYSLSEFCFDYREGKSFFPLKTAKMKNSRRHVREDLNLLNFAGLLCELSDKILAQNECVEDYYDQLNEALDHLSMNPYLSVCLFLAYVMKYLGIEPMVDECVVCGNTKVTTISISEGGFVCAQCRSKVQASSFSLDDLVHFRLVNKASFEHFELLNEKHQFSFRDVVVMMDFLLHHAGIRLHSWSFIVSVMD